MIKVAVTELEYNKAKHIFADTGDLQCLCAPALEAELAQFIRDNGISHVIIGVDKYRSELYDALPAGGVIARFGVGYDGVNLALAAKKGLLCTNTPGALDDSVAECAIGMILNAARYFSSCTADMRKGVWKNRVGFELFGKRLAIIGCGSIGLKTAKIAKAGFGMKITGCDLGKPEDCSFIDDFTTDYAEAVKIADFVSLHIPDIPSTKNYIDSSRLSAMKATAILINTARGGVVDENAVYDAVKSGVIRGAVLDVFKTEPYTPQATDKDLRTLDGVIMTPHIGSSTQEASDRMALAALKNIRQGVNGKISEMNIIPV